MHTLIKGNQPKTKKTVSYIKRMISSGTWKANKKIPSLSKISKNINVSVPTIRKAIAILEDNKILDNQGTLGFIVIPPTLSSLYHMNRQLFFIRVAKYSLNTVSLLQSGGVVLDNFIVTKKRTRIHVYDIVNSSSFYLSLNEINDILNSAIDLNTLLYLNDEDLKEAKKKYKRQEKLMPIAKLLIQNRKEIGF